MSGDESRAAAILAGPGLIRRPAALASGLDAKLQEMVQGLEAVADCPSPAFDLPQGLPPEARMARFCDALAEMGRPLIAELAAHYRGLCRSERFDPGDHAALFDQRGRALIAYFEELAKVHGVAFASDEAGAPPQEAVEEALARLSRALDESLRNATAFR